MSEPQPTNEDFAEQIRRLEARIRELTAAGGAQCTGQPVGAGEGGLAEGLLSALGRAVPGLQTLMDVAAKMPEFHDRLAAIDEEIKRKFRDQPLRQASAGVGATLGRRKMGIPPSIRRGRPAGGGAGGVGGADTDRGGGSKTPHGKYSGPKGQRIHISPETPVQLPVDVFDEGDHLAVLVEAPGLELKDFTLSLDGTVLIIAVDAPPRQGLQRVELPCHVGGDIKASLAKGVLHIHLRKADEK